MIRGGYHLERYRATHHPCPSCISVMAVYSDLDRYVMAGWLHLLRVLCIFFLLFFRQIEQLRCCEIIKEHEVKALCAKARYVLLIGLGNYRDDAFMS